jgi:hypothetical protein
MVFRTRDGTEMRGIKGYKGLSSSNESILGQSFQFEQGRVYTEDCEPRFKCRGFHFCLYLEDVRKFVPNCAKIVEVYAVGEVEGNGTEYCTNSIYIGEEVAYGNI